MARYTGPKTRIARKFGEAIFGADKVLSKKNYPQSRKLNILTGYWKNSSVTCLRKLQV